MPDPVMPAWERRFRAPTSTFPSWSPHAPDALVYISNESGSYSIPRARKKIHAYKLVTMRTAS
jgi:hypothetical protein